VPAEPPATSRIPSGVLGIVLFVLLMVLVVGGGVAYSVLRDDDPGGGSAEDPSSTGAPSGSGYTVKKGDERKAIASFATALVDQLGVSQEEAECLSFNVIRNVGLQRMVDIGMFDKDMNFLDADLAAYPDVKEAISTAALTCVRPS